MLPDALAFALLGGIESLLSAVVADGMTGRRHRSNCELVAQGVANIASALFGGICVTGTIARTATNVRAGARGPGLRACCMRCSCSSFMLVAAPLAGYIPLAALAGVLAVVAWNMAEKHEFAALLRASRGDAVVLLATFLLTVFRDLTEGIVVGFALGALLFIHRMAQAVAIESAAPLIEEDVADDAPVVASAYDAGAGHRPRRRRLPDHRRVLLRRRRDRGAALDRIGRQPKAYVLDFSAVPFLEFDGGRHHRGLRPQGPPPGCRGLRRRRQAAGPPPAPHPRPAPARAALPLDPRRGGGGCTRPAGTARCCAGPCGADGLSPVPGRAGARSGRPRCPRRIRLPPFPGSTAVTETAASTSSSPSSPIAPSPSGERPPVPTPSSRSSASSGAGSCSAAPTARLRT